MEEIEKTLFKQNSLFVPQFQTKGYSLRTPTVRST